jgi:hypothetical protein
MVSNLESIFACRHKDFVIRASRRAIIIEAKSKRNSSSLLPTIGIKDISILPNHIPVSDTTRQVVLARFLSFGFVTS